MTEESPWVGPWTERLESSAHLLAAVARGLRRPSADPFALRDEVDRLCARLEQAGLVALALPAQARAELSDLCTQLRAEFWDRFAAACGERGWDLHGTTSRRLVARGIFVELKDEQVYVEGRPGALPPYAPTVVEVLRPEVEALVPTDFHPEQFVDLLARAYERVPGEAERPVEEVYRNVVVLVQKEAFWKHLDGKSLVRLTRPAFRARLAVVLAAAPDPEGPAVRLGTTVNSARAWETFSPGEGRVVQIGRLAVVRKG
jgi:hypothetical protein